MPTDNSSSLHSGGSGTGQIDATTAGPLSWHSTENGDCVWMSPAWSALIDLGAPAGGDDWIDRVHPDDRGFIAQAWARARSIGAFAVDLRVLDRSGAHRWLRAQAWPTGEEQPAWSGTAIDVTDLHERVASEQAARAGLHHRIRNTLAVIRSIARRTAENSDTVEDHRIHFDGRLGAFARTQSHIIRSGSQGVDLESLLADELLANQAGFGDRVSYSGPEVRLPPQLADQIGLALHELADNAVQYGALGNEHGELQVRWWVAGDESLAMLHFEWREHVPGGATAPAGQEGFGMELLTRSLSYEVDAEVTMDFTPTGLLCTIQVPLG